MTFCEIQKRFLYRVIDCLPDEASTAKSILDTAEAIIAGQGDGLTARSARERTGAVCAFGAYVWDQSFAMRPNRRCPFTLTPEERAKARTYLTAYYTRRTTPRPTGDATIDRQLSELAKRRDGLCACTNSDCVRDVHAAVTDAVPMVPQEMSDAMADAEAVLDEVSRCTDRIVNELYPLP